MGFNWRWLDEYRASRSKRDRNKVSVVAVVVVAVFEVSRQVTETRVVVDTGSAAAEHFIAFYISSKTYALPAKEVSFVSSKSYNDIPSGDFTSLGKCATSKPDQA